MYGDITTRQQRMAHVDWFKVGIRAVKSTALFIGKVALVAMFLYTCALFSYVVGL